MSTFKSNSDTKAKITMHYIVDGDESIITVDQFPYLIGRDSQSVQLAIRDKTVSRVHARLTYQEGKVILENLSGTNKTFVNGCIITMPTQIHSGDQVALGSSKIIIDSVQVATTETEDIETCDDNNNAPVSNGISRLNADMLPPKEVQSESLKESSKVFCQHCGNIISPSSSFCGQCGSPVTGESAAGGQFCGKCGKKVNSGAIYCSHCGEKLSLTKDINSTKSTRIRQWAKIVAIAVPVIIVITVFCFILLHGRSYNEVVDQFVDATFKMNIEKMWKLLPKEMRNAAVEDLAESFGIQGMEGLFDYGLGYLQDQIDDVAESLDEKYGKDWRYSHKIVKENDYSKEKIADTKKELNDRFLCDMDIDAVKELDVEVSVSGKKQNEKFTFTILTIKIGRSWYLADISI